MTKIGEHIPWPVMRALKHRWPRMYHLLRYGVSNANTREHWDDAWRRHGRDGYRATGEVWPIREQVLDAIPHGCKVLDIGCGVGEMLLLLRDRNGCECYGLDIAPSAVEIAKAKGIHAELAALPHIPYGDANFDACVCTETLEHVSDAKKTIKEIQRVLRPGGIVVLSVPDGPVDEEDVHVHRFTRSSLESLLGSYLSVARIEVAVSGNDANLVAVCRKPA